MQIREIMTEDPTCCEASTPLVEVAQLMVRDDCGCIPVLDAQNRPIGVITDRDITCRATARRKNALELTAEDCMTSPCLTVPRDADIEECCRLMEDNQIRRVPVVDAGGRCCGIVTQADYAIEAQTWADELVQAVSRPTATLSRTFH